MRRWLLILNSFLLVGMLYVGYKIFLFWKSPDEKVIPEVSKIQPAKSSEIPLPSKISEPLNSYNIILAKNLFRPDRKEPRKEAEKKVEIAKKNKEEKIFLHGIVSIGSYKVALLRDGLGRDINSQRQNRFRKGDQFNDYIVKDILEDRVILKSDLEEKEIFLHDSGNPKVRARIEPRPMPQTSVAKRPSFPPGQVYQQTYQGFQQSQPIQSQQSPVYAAPPTPPSLLPSPFGTSPSQHSTYAAPPTPPSPFPSPSGTTPSQPSTATNPFLAILQEAAKRARGEIPSDQPPPSAPSPNPFAEALFGPGKK